MDIVINKDTQDPRDNRGILKAGTKLTVDNCDLWRNFVKSKKATMVKNRVSQIVLKNSDEAANYNNENEK